MISAYKMVLVLVKGFAVTHAHHVVAGATSVVHYTMGRNPYLKKLRYDPFAATTPGHVIHAPSKKGLTH